MSHHHHRPYMGSNRNAPANDKMREHAHKGLGWFLIVIAIIGLFNLLVWQPLSTVWH